MMPAAATFAPGLAPGSAPNPAPAASMATRPACPAQGPHHPLDQAPPPPDVRPLWPEGAAPSERTARRLCDLAALAAATAFAIPLAEVRAATRRRRGAAFARQVAMYLAHVAFGLSFTAIGEAFGRDRTTAAHACRLVEERRDDPAAEALLAALESACALLRRRLSRAVP